ncbi:antibiotic biosynthesis monooxygenase [Dipodascopsis uninucleata]
MGIAKTPEPPYYAVIFTSTRRDGDNGYGATSDQMLELAATMPGYLGVESAREDVGITVSYWQSLEDIARWKKQADHQQARALGRTMWYNSFTTRISKVERDYSFERKDNAEQNSE